MAAGEGKVDFIDLSLNNVNVLLGCDNERDSEQLAKILEATHSAVLTVANIFKSQKPSAEEITDLNRKVSDLLLIHGAANPGILNENEHEYINSINSRSQPGLNEVLFYGSSLLVSITARVKAAIYKLLSKILFKRTFLKELHNLLKSFIETQDISSFLTLHALAKFFLDSDFPFLDEDLRVLAFHVRKIHSFCQMNLVNVAEGNDIDMQGLSDILFITGTYLQAATFTTDANN